MGDDFGTTLRALRKAAGLTQEALARSAGLSVDCISVLERGQRRYPRADTVDLLVGGLQLDDDGIARLRALAGIRRAGPDPSPAVGRINAPRQLPASPTALFGRDQELADLVARLEHPCEQDTPQVVAVVGMAGVGKTALALHAAAALSKRYVDGQLYVDLKGHGEVEPVTPHAALGFLLTSLGSHIDDVPLDVDHASAMFRSLTADAQLLIVLDNAASAKQVDYLIPSSSRSSVIVTSRRALRSQAEIHHQVLAVLNDDDSIGMLGSMVGEARLQADVEAVSDLARGCAGLPLALRIVGARLQARPTWPLGFLADRLAETTTRLGELRVGDVAVRSTLSMSIEQLDHSDDPVDTLAARILTYIGVLPATSLSTPTLAALLDIQELDAEEGLERLADVSLLDSVAPQRYRVHDLVHAVVRERAAELLSERERTEALTRVLRFYTAVAWRSRGLSRPPITGLDAHQLCEASGRLVEVTECVDLIVDEASQMTAIARQTLTGPPEVRRTVPRLALGLMTYFVTRADTAGWAEMIELGIAAAGADQTCELAWLHQDLALAYSGRGEHERGLAQARAAIPMAQQLDDRGGEAAAYGTLAICLRRVDQVPEGLAACRRSLRLSEEAGDTRAVAAAWRNLGVLLAATGDRCGGVDASRRALGLYRELGVPRGIAMATVNLGVMLRDEGDLAESRALLEESVSVSRSIGDRALETEALDELGYWHVVAGDPQVGLTVLNHGLALVDERGPGQWEPSIRRRMGMALDGLGRHAEAEGHWMKALRLHERRGEWRDAAETLEMWKSRTDQREMGRSLG